MTTREDSVLTLPSRLYAIADADLFGEHRLVELAALWAQAGVGCVQLRMKGATERRLFKFGLRLKTVLVDYPVWFWINDSVAVARDLDATGVHLGQDDMTPSKARQLLGDGPLIGRSTHGIEQATEADNDPAVDVIAVGPIFTTTSKLNPEPTVGIDGLAAVVQSVTKPVVAIGGLNHKNCRLSIRAGAQAVAMISALGCQQGTGADSSATLMRIRELLSCLGTTEPGGNANAPLGPSISDAD